MASSDAICRGENRNPGSWLVADAFVFPRSDDADDAGRRRPRRRPGSSRTRLPAATSGLPSGAGLPAATSGLPSGAGLPAATGSGLRPHEGRQENEWVTICLTPRFHLQLCIHHCTAMVFDITFWFAVISDQWLYFIRLLLLFFVVFGNAFHSLRFWWIIKIVSTSTPHEWKKPLWLWKKIDETQPLL